MARELSCRPSACLGSSRWASEPPTPNSLTTDRAVADATEFAGAISVTESGEQSQLNRSWLQALPSWLSSMAVHLLAMILLGLMFLEAPAGQRLLTLDVSLGTAGDNGGDGENEGGDALVEIAADEPNDSPAPAIESFAEPLAGLEPTALDLSPLVLNDLAAAMTPGDAPLSARLAGTGAGGEIDGDKGRGSGRAPTRTQVFGLAEEASSFVYVFDRSQSMNSTLSYSSEGALVFSITPLEAAKAELLRSLDDLDRHQTFQIIFYNHDTVFFSAPTNGQRLLAASNATKHRAAEFVSTMPGDGGTYHLEPIELALRMRPDVVFLLTDGEAKDDPTTVDLDRIRGLNHGRSRINVIHFCFVPRPAATLVKLARENGGQYLSLNLSQLGPGIGQPQGGAADAPPPSANP